MKLFSRRNGKLFFVILPFILGFISLGVTRSSDSIVIIGRDEASGTRGSFDELVLDKEDPTPKMEAQPSNGFVHEKITTTHLAIGYVGFAYLDMRVKPLKINGISPLEESVLNGTYPIARDLNMFTLGEPEGVIKNFIDFLFSEEGQQLVDDEGFISLQGTDDFTLTSFPPGTELSIVGSTTVLPIGGIVAQRYMEINPNVSISVSGGGSSTGIKSVGENTADIGMSSRELKEVEMSDYPSLKKHVVAKDGIAVIVHPTNSITNIKLENLKQIYLGSLTTWSQVVEAEGNRISPEAIITFKKSKNKLFS